MTRRKNGARRGGGGAMSGVGQKLVHYFTQTITASSANWTATNFAVVTTRPARPVSLYLEFASQLSGAIQAQVRSASGEVVLLTPPMVASNIVQRRRFRLPAIIDYGLYEGGSVVVSFTAGGFATSGVRVVANLTMSYKPQVTIL